MYISMLYHIFKIRSIVSHDQEHLMREATGTDQDTSNISNHTFDSFQTRNTFINSVSAAPEEGRT